MKLRRDGKNCRRGMGHGPSLQIQYSTNSSKPNMTSPQLTALVQIRKLFWIFLSYEEAFLSRRLEAENSGNLGEHLKIVIPFL
jgi:hypothetical protein